MTAKKPYVVIKMVSIPDFIPSRAPFVRMTAENYVIKFTPQGKIKHFLSLKALLIQVAFHLLGRLTISKAKALTPI